MTSDKKWGEIAVALALAAAGAGFAILALRLPASHEPGIPGPGSAPAFLGLLLAACGLMIAGKAMLQKTTGAWTPAALAPWRKPLTGLILLIACAIALEPLGFILATFLFLIGGFILLGETNWRMAIPAAAVGSTGLWLFFTKLLGVGLPYGLIEQILFR